MKVLVVGLLLSSGVMYGMRDWMGDSSRPQLNAQQNIKTEVEIRRDFYWNDLIETEKRVSSLTPGSQESLIIISNQYQIATAPTAPIAQKGVDLYEMRDSIELAQQQRQETILSVVTKGMQYLVDGDGK